MLALDKILEAIPGKDFTKAFTGKLHIALSPNRSTLKIHHKSPYPILIILSYFLMTMMSCFHYQPERRGMERERERSCPSKVGVGLELGNGDNELLSPSAMGRGLLG